MNGSEFRSGFAAVAGKPNVGKSTLVNRLVGQKVSITSRKPQTTRHRILGISNSVNTQLILVDTPGLHQAQGKMMNRMINRTARNSFEGVDVVLVVITYKGWDSADETLLELVEGISSRLILVINKIDRLKKKSELLPLIKESQNKGDFLEVVPVSALTGENMETLHSVIRNYLPVAEAPYPTDQVTDKSIRFLSAELLREQLFRRLGDELPYVTAVNIESFKESSGRIDIDAEVWVEKDSHKGIIIGKGGEKLKQMGTNARIEIEKYVDTKVNLHIWVKVRKGWSDDQNALSHLGYIQD